MIAAVNILILAQRASRPNLRLLRENWQLLLMTALVFAFWQSPAVAPLKILIVFVHEAAHAIATYVTGGEVASLSILPDRDGAVISRGGNRFVILTSGYLGSLLIGVGLLLAATRTRVDRKIMALCGIVMLVIAGFYVRELFALFFAIDTGVLMLLAARSVGHTSNDLFLRVIGLTSIV
jgi:exosortase/archaeosortase